MEDHFCKGKKSKSEGIVQSNGAHCALEMNYVPPKGAKESRNPPSAPKDPICLLPVCSEHQRPKLNTQACLLEILGKKIGTVRDNYVSRKQLD